LKKYNFSNAEQDDLWLELTKQAHIDERLDPKITVKDIMDTWTLRKGYPLVKVDRNYDRNRMTLTQEWFLVNPLNNANKSTDYADYKWFVPITFTDQNVQSFEFESNTTWMKPTDSYG
jgi:aminopeptidase N